MPKKNPTFELTASHIKLISSLNFKPHAYWEDGCPGSICFQPEISPKRPFGNSGVAYDVADRLNLLTELPDGDREMTPGAERRAMRILIELPVALEIVTRKHTFEPGVYELERYSAYFEYRSYMLCWFWLDAIRACAEIKDPRGHDLLERAFTFTRSVPGNNPYSILARMREWSHGQGPGSAIMQMYAVFRDHAAGKYRASHLGTENWDSEAIAAVLIQDGDRADTSWPFWDDGG
ncbi:MAG: hypothetical protein NC311_10075 [Muribaculaceae bacterium]|nr:hypothetical protein [Muribaculaceae bacterium]